MLARPSRFCPDTIWPRCAARSVTGRRWASRQRDRFYPSPRTRAVRPPRAEPHSRRGVVTPFTKGGLSMRKSKGRRKSGRKKRRCRCQSTGTVSSRSSYFPVKSASPVTGPAQSPSARPWDGIGGGIATSKRGNLPDRDQSVLTVVATHTGWSGSSLRLDPDNDAAQGAGGHCYPAPALPTRKLSSPRVR